MVLGGRGQGIIKVETEIEEIEHFYDGFFYLF